ncbi:MAG: tRNA epoxyqueuosine(34) reductase QueG, partial [Pseudomonadota bacterium]
MNAASTNFVTLAQDIRTWSKELGFDEIGITNTELNDHETHLMNWLAAGYHGEMQYMHEHGTKRSRPDDLIPGTIR